jgi:hypothetical protein
MAVQSGPASSEKKSSNGVNELLTFNAENMQSNMKIIYYRFGCTFLILIMEQYDSVSLYMKQSHKCLIQKGETGICYWVGPMKRNNCLLLFKVYNWIFCLFCSRTFLSIIGGVVAGILGFTGLKGFVFYSLLMAFTSLGLIAKAKFSIHTYFDSWNRVLVDGFLGGLMVGFLCSLHLSFVMICVWKISFTFESYQWPSLAENILCLQISIYKNNQDSK